MKIIPSALVAELKGSTADLTCASWKGINYCRRKVTPSNPNSAAQQAVRAAFSSCVTLWRSLVADAKTWLDTYGTDYAQSGFNVFMSKNRALEQAGSALAVMPANPNVPVPSTVAFVTGIGVAGDIDVTWVDDAPGVFDLFAVAVRLATGDLFVAETSAAKAAATLTISGLTAGASYDCYAYWKDSANIIYGTTDGTLSVSAKA